ncbi:hypothetical protein [Geobacter sp. OR-1]|uniref:hypothetical protein n=1 Tax=Geobacter sp. OR-1 TaxID=1266765 RepID=UPI001269D023|nr:hypothetical protein [Geobacter sp. OR-1]
MHNLFSQLHVQRSFDFGSEWDTQQHLSFGTNARLLGPPAFAKASAGTPSGLPAGAFVFEAARLTRHGLAEVVLYLFESRGLDKT